ncbi:MAG: glucose-1-phosphate adenylyltransferase [Candidatus Eisenbacteria bacterium]|uniref:Glucose-1-phosphate adenylyltransferase n=1 Tax=Eiseniibacteriota bacterium TaxID=2212470 RepID=A0A948RZN3_UNCEI|nr:glucose-1-phosphate adenylyltransferase [Candidatus Eisenbacteria bacterium]MBU1950483.1 glucose-1-phosphate adenylyltransferase [Candidatus Eisenbacteria bacterium]MBU2692534.1 glucose-1-phosphate adenylyltransferase [Candidatus Eisenbacteria bacterium]
MFESRLKLPSTVAFILAGGRVGELSVLTLSRPMAAVPFGGIYRIIDFALSNLMHAGVSQIGIIPQYLPSSLIDHVGIGANWDLTGPGRGAKILPPHLGPNASHWYEGGADAVRQNLNYVKDIDPELVLIISGDHVYQMDYRRLIEFHLEHDSDVTIAFRPMGSQTDRRFGYGVLGSDGRLEDYQEKPHVLPSDLASLTVYLFRRSVLEKVLEEAPPGEQTFGQHVLPRMLGTYRMYGWMFQGYWGYCRTPSAYFRSNMDVLSGIADPEAWQIRTNLYDQGLGKMPPVSINASAKIQNSLVSPGCVISGEVQDSILSPGVCIEKGALVNNCLLFHNTVVMSGAVIHTSIIDKKSLIEPNAEIGAPLPAMERLRDKDLVILGKDAIVEKGVRLPPGERMAGGPHMKKKATEK